jgi:hypothetical protein
MWRLFCLRLSNQRPLTNLDIAAAMKSLPLSALKVIGKEIFKQKSRTWKVYHPIPSKKRIPAHDFLFSLEIAHAIIDLMLQAAQNPSANTSPSTPSSPSPHPSPRNQHFSGAQNYPTTPAPYKADQLIRLKIVMRETEHPPRLRQSLPRADPSFSYDGDNNALLGRNEGTVRFLFRPPGVAGHGD